jgi:hypothetical protein
MEFRLRMGQYTASQLVFMDESAYDQRTSGRRYGRSLRGTRATKRTFFVRGQRYSIEAALSIDGLIGYSIIEGSVNSDLCCDFVEKVLVRCIYFHAFSYSKRVIIIV